MYIFILNYYITIIAYQYERKVELKFFFSLNLISENASILHFFLNKIY